jgi:hypothetical protein
VSDKAYVPQIFFLDVISDRSDSLRKPNSAAVVIRVVASDRRAMNDMPARPQMTGDRVHLLSRVPGAVNQDV